MERTSTERTKAVIRAAERWRKDLVDTSGRSPLLRYRDLKLRSLDLTPGRSIGPTGADSLDRLLAARRVSLSDLFRDAPPGQSDPAAFIDARRRLTALRKAARTNLEEKGVETLFVSVGLATWEVRSGAPPKAPVVLVPLDVEAKQAAAHDFKLQLTGDAHLNPLLAHILQSEYGIDTDDVEADVAGDPPCSYEAFTALLDRLQASWKILPGLAMESRVVTAIFSYSTLPLVRDLEQNGELFAKNDMVAAIAGDRSAREALASRIQDPRSNQPDVDPPSEEFLVLDADSSQHLAINRVLGGESLVIQGPPGTGKSQTIANLITALIARRKRVLFVAEKRAAIEAVTKRLDQVRLGELVMDLHGGVTSRREFARTLDASLERVATIPALDHTALHRRLREHRESLAQNDAALHKARDPWGLCVFDMRQRMLGVPQGARIPLRLSSDEARSLDAEGFDRLAAEMRTWLDLGGHTLASDHPEWNRASITSPEAALQAFDLVTDLAGRRLPEAQDAIFSALDEAQLPRLETVTEWRAVARFLSVASGSRWGRVKAGLLSKEHRAIRRALKAPDSLSLAAGRVKVAIERVEDLASGLSHLASVTGLDGLEEMPHSDLADALDRMAASRTVAANLPLIGGLEASFRRTGVMSVLKRVGEDLPPSDAVRAAEHAWLGRVLNDLEFEDQRLSTFDGTALSRHRDGFTKADREHRDITPQRVQRLAAEAIIATMNAHPEETEVVRREARKKRRHLSVRQLLARAPNVLTALRPCWTMSPILAAEMIPADLGLFDTVIFDEASQIPPAEAIGSLARAPQTVIAGDSRQLPPTQFFGRGAGDDDDDDDDDLSLISNIESLLDVAGALLRNNMLQWHYRSRDDRLIAFSNNHMYGGGLTAFPGAAISAPVSHHLIPYRPIIGVSGTRSNPDEVTDVVDLVIEHAHTAPQETLGVIAFGQHHANQIENALTRRLGEINDPSVDEFFSERKEEPFFVKNIERVQGDERDAIILSVGYHKDANGNLPYRFGPILQEGGERRLNVAVTRARSRLTLVSSFSHRDMDPGRSSARGVALLRNYLEYAASGGTNLGGKVHDVPLNPFELDVKEGLERRGIPVTAQYGVSGYRIDFACAHPDEPGRMVLAVEADGASYHSAPTVRDRDRLRQQVLEDKGWRFHRIWSTAWFRDRMAELDKAEEAWKQAVEASDRDEPPLRRDPCPTPPPSGPSPQRGPRPSVPRKGARGYESITSYRHVQLVELARWIESDTLLRTEDDMIREMMNDLGFSRSGKRITAALTRAIRDARGGYPSSPPARNRPGAASVW